ncbi:hypothetical protein RDI58_010639 [Solanum bulbocastanum]|uniref:Uncharacterized protein n=1 Tax=Solanum bulbocastanum TaxID=147425 RepID=A0AAN8TV59_SOLBU
MNTFINHNKFNKNKVVFIIVLQTRSHRLRNKVYNTIC